MLVGALILQYLNNDINEDDLQKLFELSMITIEELEEILEAKNTLENETINIDIYYAV